MTTSAVQLDLTGEEAAKRALGYAIRADAAFSTCRPSEEVRALVAMSGMWAEVAHNLAHPVQPDVHPLQKQLIELRKALQMLVARSETGFWHAGSCHSRNCDCSTCDCGLEQALELAH